MFSFRKLFTEKYLAHNLTLLRNIKTKLPIDAMKPKKQKPKINFNKNHKTDTFEKRLESIFARKQGGDIFAMSAMGFSALSLVAYEVLRRTFLISDPTSHSVEKIEPIKHHKDKEKGMLSNFFSEYLDTWQWLLTPDTSKTAKPDEDFIALIKSVLDDIEKDKDKSPKEPTGLFASLEKERTDINKPLDINDFEVYFTDTLSIYGTILNTPKTLTFGSALGLPFYMSYKSIDDVKFSDLMQKGNYKKTIFLDNLQINLDQLTGKSGDEIDELKATFVLSPEAKKFVIASHMVEFTSKTMFLFKLMQSLVFFSLYVCAASSWNQSLQMFSRPFMMRLGCYAMFLSLTALSLMETNRRARGALDQTCVVLACKLGRDYAAGGVEFYEKAYKRISLLKKLLPETEEYFDIRNDLKISTPPNGFRVGIKDRLNLCKFAQEKLEKKLPVESTHTFTQFLLENDFIR